MKILNWLDKNKNTVDWADLSRRWDKMQMVHNPYRNDQIDTIYYLSGVQTISNPKILDLCCGPGALSKYFLLKNENLTVFAVDIDPFLIEIFKNSYPQDRITIELYDIRKSDFFDKFQNRFDSVISLTALHWLSKDTQKQLYKRIYSILKPGGTFLNGDPYLPVNKFVQKNLDVLQKEKAREIEGETWDQYWENIFLKYNIKELIDEMKSILFLWEDFEGSEGGYSVDFYISSLTEAGFKSAAVYWQGGLRVVYGGIK